ncbi:MAG: DEAD/DEAH box helicase [Thermoplasmata archaeon]|nr:DEAD/DEAH box helicase [Thermoplasmata archaeon]
MNTFRELGLSDKLLRSIEILGFTEPTRIQKDTIPLILEGKDVIGESETGSGKTLAFGCGIVDKCSRDEGIQALILTPTRELAEQVKDSLKELTHKPRLNIIAVFGGVSIYNQIKNLKRANVVVATPGRLLDHIDRGTIDLRSVKILVMDEADRMFDMGFIDDVKKIIKRCPGDRQTMFFSATISKEVKNLANRHMETPETVLAGNIVDPAKLKQVTVRVAKTKKFSLLTHILKHEEKPLAMVFCNTRHLSDFVDKNLRFNGVKAAAIHGGLTQNARLKAIDRFNAHEVNVLVCTDVAARGLHIKNVSHVINYDLPQDPNDYVHRIGRTARAGESGQVINILTNFDKNLMKKIQWENKTFNIGNMEINDFKDANITTTIGRIKKDHSARPGSSQKWGNKDGGSRNANEKNKQWHSSKNHDGDYRPKSGGQKPKYNNYKGKSDDYKPKSGGYKERSGDYKEKSDGRNSKPGSYKGKPNGRNSKSGNYKGKSDSYKPNGQNKDWRSNKKKGGQQNKSGGSPHGQNKDWRSNKKRGGNYKSKSSGNQGPRHHN